MGKKGQIFSNVWDKEVTCNSELSEKCEGLSFKVYILISPGKARILPLVAFPVDLVEGRGLDPRSFEGPFLSDFNASANFPPREGERPRYMLV